VIDRRAVFFLGAAVVCFALTTVVLDEFRRLTVVLASVYLVLALLSALDHWSRRRN
jgi:hypothetical protein